MMFVFFFLFKLTESQTFVCVWHRIVILTSYNINKKKSPYSSTTYVCPVICTDGIQSKRTIRYYRILGNRMFMTFTHFLNFYMTVVPDKKHHTFRDQINNFRNLKKTRIFREADFKPHYHRKNNCFFSRYYTTANKHPC